MENRDSSFYLEVSKNNEPDNIIRTTEFFVVRYKLIASELISPWYKELGGKDNAIEIKVALINNFIQPVLSHPVPLNLTLYYENGNLVQKQSILKILGNAIIGETGEALVRVRIEEVSRGHQRQRFMILISPNIQRDPRNNDISPVFTTPVDVMSKPKGGVCFEAETLNGKGSRKKVRSKSDINNDCELPQPPSKRINSKNNYFFHFKLFINILFFFR